MSFDAIRWALRQEPEKSPTKFVLVAMAEFVNAESAEWVCWPSYRAIAAVTLQDTKTVEAAVYRLKKLGLIVDTGQRKGETAKVIVYRLNDPASGVVTPGPQPGSANGTRPQNDTASGVVIGSGNPPKFPPNPPDFPDKSPRLSGATTPKTGDGSSNGTSKRTRKEAGRGEPAPIIPGVDAAVVSDWMVVRKAKRAGQVTQTVVDILTREAANAGLSLADAVSYCCGAGWQNFNASHYANRESGYGKGSGRQNAQEALEASNRAVAARYLEKTDVAH